MLVALVVTAFGVGVHLPGDTGRIDVRRVAEMFPTGVTQTAPGQYEVHLTGQIWSYVPSEIRVPRGSSVHFLATSRDVVHGLFIPHANVNVMLVPGQIAHIVARFDKPGEYPTICHEYCGIAHHTMAGRVVVE